MAVLVVAMAHVREVAEDVQGGAQEVVQVVVPEVANIAAPQHVQAVVKVTHSRIGVNTFRDMSQGISSNTDPVILNNTDNDFLREF